MVAIKGSVSSIWNKGVQLNTVCGVVLGNETTFFLLSHFGEKPRATACYNMRTTPLYNTLTNDMHFYIVNTFQKVPLEDFAQLYVYLKAAFIQKVVMEGDKVLQLQFLNKFYAFEFTNLSPLIFFLLPLF